MVRAQGNPPELGEVAEAAGAGAVHGIGRVVLGPLVAGAVEAPEAQRALRGVLIKLGLAIAGGVALGMFIGRRF